MSDDVKMPLLLNTMPFVGGGLVSSKQSVLCLTRQRLVVLAAEIGKPKAGEAARAVGVA